MSHLDSTALWSKDNQQSKPYHDTDGNSVSLLQLCEKEPHWAANTIEILKLEIAQLSTQKRILVDYIRLYTQHGYVIDVATIGEVQKILDEVARASLKGNDVK